MHLSTGILASLIKTEILMNHLKAQRVKMSILIHVLALSG